jgi:hypothetical protein
MGQRVLFGRDQEIYPSNLSIGNAGSKIQRGGAGIDERKSKRYRDILSGTHVVKHAGDSLGSPQFRREKEERTDGLLSIIKSCESLKESYQST